MLLVCLGSLFYCIAKAYYVTNAAERNSYLSQCRVTQVSSSITAKSSEQLCIASVGLPGSIKAPKFFVYEPTVQYSGFEYQNLTRCYKYVDFYRSYDVDIKLLFDTSSSSSNMAFAVKVALFFFAYASLFIFIYKREAVWVFALQAKELADNRSVMHSAIHDINRTLDATLINTVLEDYYKDHQKAQSWVSYFFSRYVFLIIPENAWGYIYDG